MTHIVNLRKQKNKTEEPQPQTEESLVVVQKLEPPPVPEPEEPEKTVEVTEAPKSSPRFSWEAPSFYYNPQKKYLALVIVSLLAGAGAIFFYGHDLLLAIFLILSVLVLILYAGKKPDILRITIDRAGVSINEQGYYYKELKSFWIDYNPGGVKELSLESKKWYMPHIKLSIEKEDPIELRSLMVNFVPERVHEQSLVDFVARKMGL